MLKNKKHDRNRVFCMVMTLIKRIFNSSNQEAQLIQQSV